MKPTTVGVLVAVIVVAGKWASNEELEATDAIAAGVMTIMLILLSALDQELATVFGWLIVAAVVFAPIEGGKSYGAKLLEAVQR